MSKVGTVQRGFSNGKPREPMSEEELTSLLSDFSAGGVGFSLVNDKSSKVTKLVSMKLVVVPLTLVEKHGRLKKLVKEYSEGDKFVGVDASRNGHAKLILAKAAREYNRILKDRKGLDEEELEVTHIMSNNSRDDDNEDILPGTLSEKTSMLAEINELDDLVIVWLLDPNDLTVSQINACTSTFDQLYRAGVVGRHATVSDDGAGSAIASTVKSDGRIFSIGSHHKKHNDVFEKVARYTLDEVDNRPSQVYTEYSIGGVPPEKKLESITLVSGDDIGSISLLFDGITLREVRGDAGRQYRVVNDYIVEEDITKRGLTDMRAKLRRQANDSRIGVQHDSMRSVQSRRVVDKSEGSELSAGGSLSAGTQAGTIDVMVKGKKERRVISAEAGQTQSEALEEHKARYEADENVTIVSVNPEDDSIGISSFKKPIKEVTIERRRGADRTIETLIVDSVPGVDDEEVIRKAIRRIREEDGVRVLSSRTPLSGTETSVKESDGGYVLFNTNVDSMRSIIDRLPVEWDAMFVLVHNKILTRNLENRSREKSNMQPVSVIASSVQQRGMLELYEEIGIDSPRISVVTSFDDIRGDKFVDGDDLVKSWDDAAESFSSIIFDTSSVGLPPNEKLAGACRGVSFILDNVESKGQKVILPKELTTGGKALVPVTPKDQKMGLRYVSIETDWKHDDIPNPLEVLGGWRTSSTANFSPKEKLEILKKYPDTPYRVDGADRESGEQPLKPGESEHGAFGPGVPGVYDAFDHRGDTRTIRLSKGGRYVVMKTSDSQYKKMLLRLEKNVFKDEMIRYEVKDVTPRLLLDYGLQLGLDRSVVAKTIAAEYKSRVARPNWWDFPTLNKEQGVRSEEDILDYVSKYDRGTIVFAASGAGKSHFVQHANALGPQVWKVKVSTAGGGMTVYEAKSQDELRRLTDAIRRDKVGVVISTSRESEGRGAAYVLNMTFLAYVKASKSLVADPYVLATKGQNIFSDIVMVGDGQKASDKINRVIEKNLADMGNPDLSYDLRTTSEGKRRVMVTATSSIDSLSEDDRVKVVEGASNTATKRSAYGTGPDYAKEKMIHLADVLGQAVKKMTYKFNVTNGRDVKPMSDVDGHAIACSLTPLEALGYNVTPWATFSPEYDHARKGCTGFIESTDVDVPVLSVDNILSVFGANHEFATHVNSGGDMFRTVLSFMSGPVKCHGSQSTTLLRMGYKKITNKRMVTLVGITYLPGAMYRIQSIFPTFFLNFDALIIQIKDHIIHTPMYGMVLGQNDLDHVLNA